MVKELILQQYYIIIDMIKQIMVVIVKNYLQFIRLVHYINCIRIMEVNHGQMIHWLNYQRIQIQYHGHQVILKQQKIGLHLLMMKIGVWLMKNWRKLYFEWDKKAILMPNLICRKLDLRK